MSERKEYPDEGLSKQSRTRLKKKTKTYLEAEQIKAEAYNDLYEVFKQLDATSIEKTIYKIQSHGIESDSDRIKAFLLYNEIGKFKGIIDQLYLTLSDILDFRRTYKEKDELGEDARKVLLIMQNIVDNKYGAIGGYKEWRDGSSFEESFYIEFPINELNKHFNINPLITKRSVKTILDKMLEKSGASARYVGLHSSGYNNQDAIKIDRRNFDILNNYFNEVV